MKQLKGILCDVIKRKIEAMACLEEPSKPEVIFESKPVGDMDWMFRVLRSSDFIFGIFIEVLSMKERIIQGFSTENVTFVTH